MYKKITGVLRNSIWELRDSNPGQDAGHAAVFHGVPQSLHASAWALPQIRLCLLLLRHSLFTFHCHSITPRFIPRVLLRKQTKRLKNAKHRAEWHRDGVKLTVPFATGSGNSNRLTLLALGNEGACYTGERGPSVTGNKRSPTVEGGVAGFWRKN
jgi:hypothetical protein